MPQDGSWVLGDGERFSAGPSFATRDEALAHALAEESSSFIGRVSSRKISYYVDAFDVEALGEAAFEDVGECCGNWPMPGSRAEVDELRRRIGSALDEWADEFGHQPDFFRVDEIERVPYPAEPAEPPTQELAP
jgi:hypothetical protein